MELLPTTKWILTWLCIYRASEFTQKWETIAQIVFFIMVFIGTPQTIFESSYKKIKITCRTLETKHKIPIVEFLNLLRNQSDSLS